MDRDQRLLYLIRHGATEANLRRPYVLQGQRTDLSLAEIGRRQAEAAARVLAGRAIERFVSSPLRRAMETAAIVASPHRRYVRSVPELIECDVGRWEGLSWQAIRQQDAEHCAAFEADPATVPYAGGESFEQVRCRALAATERLLEEYPNDNLAIVTHNVVARVLVAHWMEVPLSKARGIRQDNGGITLVAVADRQARVLTVNSIFHLDGLIVD